MDKTREIFKKVWIAHFGHSKQLNADLEVILKHDYIFEAMQQYANEIDRENENKASQLIKLLDEYIDFIGEELSELAVMASNRGWESNRAKEGESKRNEILAIRNDWKSNQEEQS